MAEGKTSGFTAFLGRRERSGLRPAATSLGLELDQPQKCPETELSKPPETFLSAWAQQGVSSPCV